jgi:hypothetical protein
MTTNSASNRQPHRPERLEALGLSGTDHLTYDHVKDLYSIASETHASPRLAPDDRAGVALRVRAAVGRRIVTLGSAVAGTRVAGTRA